MAWYWKKLDNIPEASYFEIIVNPMLDCLKNSGIEIDSSKSPKSTGGFEDIKSEFFLQAGGSIGFYRTLVPTENIISGGIADRHTLITIKGIQKDSNITDDIVNQALHKFESYLIENGFGCGKIQEGDSISGKIQERQSISGKIQERGSISGKIKKGGSTKEACYIATAVYGSYDCQEVWVLRRYRDNTLVSKWYGRLFVKIYYFSSPTVVRLFGKSKVINSYWKANLDKIVTFLQERGFDNTPYND